MGRKNGGREIDTEKSALHRGKRGRGWQEEYRGYWWWEMYSGGGKGAGTLYDWNPCNYLMVIQFKKESGLDSIVDKVLALHAVNLVRTLASPKMILLSTATSGPQAKNIHISCISDNSVILFCTNL